MTTIRLPSKCSTEGRALIVAELQASIEEVDEAVAEESWMAEIERRSAELADGRVQAIPWETVPANILKQLEDRRRGDRPSS
jgi:putative addiction module component (TIGR02574 family)